MFVNKPNYINIMAYHGPISLELTSFVGNYMKDAVIVDKKIVTRIFKVFIELVQNISNYSAQSNEQIEQIHNKNNGVGWFSIDDTGETYRISTGNLIVKEHGPILEHNVSQINKLDEPQLRELKRQTRKQAGIRDIGAHIGLIHTGIITRNPIEMEISPVDETHSFFKITAQVSKTINN